MSLGNVERLGINVGSASLTSLNSPTSLNSLSTALQWSASPFLEVQLKAYLCICQKREAQALNIHRNGGVEHLGFGGEEGIL